MGNIMITLPDNLLALAYTEAVARSTSLDVLVEDALRTALEEPSEPPRPTINLDAIVQGAITVARQKAVDERFLVKDISDPDEWGRMTATQRKIFGKRFRQAVEGEGIATFVRRTSANHAEYQRKAAPAAS